MITWCNDTFVNLISLGPPVDPDDDSDNSSVYVQGLNDSVTLEELADFFKQCGVVKVGNSVCMQDHWSVVQQLSHQLVEWDGNRTVIPSLFHSRTTHSPHPVYPLSRKDSLPLSDMVPTRQAENP